MLQAQNHRLTIQNESVEKVDWLKYMGIIITDNDDDWNAMKHNLDLTRNVWSRFRKILVKIKAFSDIKEENFYKLIVMSVLLYGSETCVISKTLYNKIKYFHNGVIWSICQLPPVKNPITGVYEYADITTAMKRCGIK